MNKKITYLFLILLFLGGSAFIVLRYQQKLNHKYTAFYPLKDRKGANALRPEWASIKTKAEKLIVTVREQPQDTKSALALATLYVQESRITGQHQYYDAAALTYINQVLQADSVNFEALTLKALILLSQHHFAEALVVAEKAQKIGPYNAFVYGLLIDGYVEMGNYKAAIVNADKMVSLRPDIRSFSRISYLREIHGDNAGAIEAMQSAVKAGGFGDEATAWSRVQLGRLFENKGDLKSAEMHYTIALDERPGYAYAIAGMGRLAMAQKDYKRGIQLFHQADTSMMDFSFKEELAKAYTLTGDNKKATQTFDELIEGLQAHAEEAELEEEGAHHADLELASVYLLANDFGNALKHALAEYQRRPKNIEVNEMVAWAAYKKGDHAIALKHIENALITNCKNPVLLCRAGLIYAKNSQTAKSAQLLNEGLKNNPNIDATLKNESLKALQNFSIL